MLFVAVVISGCHLYHGGVPCARAFVWVFVSCCKDRGAVWDISARVGVCIMCYGRGGFQVGPARWTAIIVPYSISILHPRQELAGLCNCWVLAQRLCIQR